MADHHLDRLLHLEVGLPQQMGFVRDHEASVIQRPCLSKEFYASSSQVGPSYYWQCLTERFVIFALVLICCDDCSASSSLPSRHPRQCLSKLCCPRLPVLLVWVWSCSPTIQEQCLLLTRCLLLNL